MTLAPSTRLGPYEVNLPLGAGGMGEVYRARDTRLGREVAIKVLPAAASSDSERLRRFEQEARATGILNHPNILAIYDVGTHDGAPYVVSELLEGETLRERLAGGPLPLRKVIDYALQAARGLAAAHEKGIVHRDLKPENLFITRDGRVKILDFGLAKLTQPFRHGDGSTNVATLRFESDPGMIMGTAGYMSPEQVRGLPVDHRSDVFSFGAVLYEMLTGKRAFRGDSTVETMNAILKEDPPELSTASGSIPLSLLRVVGHCLEKKPEERFQSAWDLAFALEALSGMDVSGSGAAGAGVAGAPRWKRLVAPLVAVVLLASLAGAYALGSGAHTEEAPSFQRLTFRRGWVHSARFAPDGKTIVYSATWEGNRNELFTARPESPESRSLGLADANILAISSTGEMAIKLDPYHRSVLARAPLAGGAPREVVEGAVAADWSPDGSNLAVIRYVDGRIRVEYPIDAVLYETPNYLTDLRVSPDGSTVAFLERPTKTSTSQSLVVIRLGGERQVLAEDLYEARGVAWSPGGEVWLTVSEVSGASAILAFDTSGARRVVTRTDGRVTLHDIARDGRALVTRDNVWNGVSGLLAGETKERDLSWLDGSVAADVSVDGRTLLISELGQGGGASRSVYLRRADSPLAVKLGEGSAQSLSPDGRWALSILPSSPPRLVMLPTGTGQQRVLDPGPVVDYKAAFWFPDGRRVLFLGREADKGWRCYVQDVGGGAPRAFTPEGTWAHGNVISPDGGLAVAQDEHWNFAVYPVGGGEPRPLPGLGEGDQVVRWSPDGRAFYVCEAERAPVRIYRYDLAAGRKEPWREVMPSDAAGSTTIANYLTTPDGKAYVYTYRRRLSDLNLVSGLS
jgi:Tol biopolymer transport system component